MQISRRSFGKQSLGSLLTFSLLETLAGTNAFAEKVRPEIESWLADLDQLGRDVKEQRVSQIVWQAKVEALFGKVELPELLRLIDFEQLTRNLQMVDNGARSLKVKFPKIEGVPEKLVFGRQVFALKKDRSVVPHGHNNMATAFLVLKGSLRGRHYDRLEDLEDAIVLRPTIDRGFGPGDHSSVSDYRDNVHWFQATSDRAFIFNIHVLDVRPGSEAPTGRVYVDPQGEKLQGGLIKSRRLGYKEAHELYG